MSSCPFPTTITTTPRASPGAAYDEGPVLGGGSMFIHIERTKIV